MNKLVVRLLLVTIASTYCLASDNTASNERKYYKFVINLLTYTYIRIDIYIVIYVIVPLTYIFLNVIKNQNNIHNESI